MILTFLDFFRRGLPTHKKISFLGGPAHFVTYGDDGDGLVDNNNALTTMASALKNLGPTITWSLLGPIRECESVSIRLLCVRDIEDFGNRPS
jgi:hypothetical protein